MKYKSKCNHSEKYTSKNCLILKLRITKSLISEINVHLDELKTIEISHYKIKSDKHIFIIHFLNTDLNLFVNILYFNCKLNLIILYCICESIEI